ncbi:MAG: hypothetical protein AAFZ18_34120 [Myxococcota bacterium]
MIGYPTLGVRTSAPRSTELLGGTSEEVAGRFYGANARDPDGNKFCFFDFS